MPNPPPGGQPPPRPLAGPWVERWLSAPRFAPYLSAAGGDRDHALDLYEWNAELSAALMHDLAHLEVGVRNAYDAAITATRPAGALHWLDDPSSPILAPRPRTKRLPDGSRKRIDVNHRLRELVEQARRRCRPTDPIGKVIAELQLGFWRYLTSAAHEKALWVPHLHTAFPPGTNRTTADRSISNLHRLRNRVAHHEPLFTLPIAAQSAELIRLCSLLETELGQHVQAVTRVPDVLAHRP